jgi:hypothetical protein
MAIQLPRTFVWLLITVFTAQFFAASTNPRFHFTFRLLLGAALFLSISMLVGFPRRIDKSVRTHTFRACAMAGVEGGVILMVILLFARWLYPEVTFDKGSCEAIARAAESGKLVETSPGLLMLPPDVSDAALHGRVYVTHLPAGRLYLFKTKEVRLWTQYFSGYVYSTIPVADLVTRDYGGASLLELDLRGAWQGRPPVLEGVMVKPTASNHWLRVLGPGWPPTAHQ